MISRSLFVAYNQMVFGCEFGLYGRVNAVSTHTHPCRGGGTVRAGELTGDHTLPGRFASILQDCCWNMHLPFLHYFGEKYSVLAFLMIIR